MEASYFMSLRFHNLFTVFVDNFLNQLTVCSVGFKLFIKSDDTLFSAIQIFFAMLFVILNTSLMWISEEMAQEENKKF